eukprot:CAMPEP_0204863980 /NCGR_PEP_ID=MMETSP1348-20121228/3722_1 /ASSEMBLY_ACC=CAM_ASM_000700 /TAXON_ID=215587 /ORGANISM="Aplanochytrium stocchinoi, Strain GSBS06" /LENGTH=453 /DNA_ID=CAMNT_0052014463 /DNA_START=64 /DNA_END=1425 /DNA_ORIENTATION=-
MGNPFSSIGYGIGGAWTGIDRNPRHVTQRASENKGTIPFVEYPSPDDTVVDEDVYMEYFNSRRLGYCCIPILREMALLVPPYHPEYHDILAKRHLEKFYGSGNKFALLDIFHKTPNLCGSPQSPLHIFAGAELAFMAYNNINEVESVLEDKESFEVNCVQADEGGKKSQVYVIRCPDPKDSNNGFFFITFRGPDFKLMQPKSKFMNRIHKRMGMARETIGDWIKNFKDIELVPVNEDNLDAGEIGKCWEEQERLLHKGISNLLTDDKYSSYKIFLGGHCTGGAMAITFAARCSESIKGRINAIYTYGSPTVGSCLFNQYLGRLENRIIRIVNSNDFVAEAIPKFAGFGTAKKKFMNFERYVHCGAEMRLEMAECETWFFLHDPLHLALLNHAPNLYLAKLWKLCKTDLNNLKMTPRKSDNVTNAAPHNDIENGFTTGKPMLELRQEDEWLAHN